MAEDEVEHAARADVEVAVVEPDLVHVLLVEHSVNLGAWSLRAR